MMDDALLRRLGMLERRESLKTRLKVRLNTGQGRQRLDLFPHGGTRFGKADF
jgi:hypothetical protein